MLDAIGLKHPQSLRYLTSIDPKHGHTTIEDWFNESLILARIRAYKDASGNKLTTGATISEAYLKRSKPIIIKRIRVAAARLAYLLNEISEGKQIFIYRVKPSQSLSK